MVRRQAAAKRGSVAVAGRSRLVASVGSHRSETVHTGEISCLRLRGSKTTRRVSTATASAASIRRARRGRLRLIAVRRVVRCVRRVTQLVKRSVTRVAQMMRMAIEIDFVVVLLTVAVVLLGRN